MIIPTLVVALLAPVAVIVLGVLRRRADACRVAIGATTIEMGYASIGLHKPWIAYLALTIGAIATGIAVLLDRRAVRGEQGSETA